MPHDEQEEISSQQEISEDGQDSAEEAQAEQSLEQDESGVPEKYLGKSTIDVIQMHRALESKLGQISSERAQAQKEREELQARLEQVLSNPPVPPTHVDQGNNPDPVEEVDPFRSFDEKFEEDPKGAIQHLFQSSQQKAQAEREKLLRAQRAEAANNYYYKQQKENPDYVRREPSMRQLIQRYAHIIHPNYRQSAEALEILDLASKGADVGYYEKAVAERLQKEGLSVREEKRRAQSESSTTEGDRVKQAKDMTTEELEALLGFSDE